MQLVACQPLRVELDVSGFVIAPDYFASAMFVHNCELCILTHGLWQLHAYLM